MSTCTETGATCNSDLDCCTGNCTTSNGVQYCGSPICGNGISCPDGYTCICDGTGLNCYCVIKDYNIPLLSFWGIVMFIILFIIILLIINILVKRYNREKYGENVGIFTMGKNLIKHTFS